MEKKKDKTTLPEVYGLVIELGNALHESYSKCGLTAEVYHTTAEHLKEAILLLKGNTDD